VQDRLALDQRVDSLLQARARLEQELAGLELSAMAIEERVKLEQGRVVDHALAGQEPGDLAGAGVLGNDHGLVGRERSGLARLPLEPHHREHHRKRDHRDEGEKPAQQRHQPAAFTRHPSGRRWRGGRLQGFARAARRKAYFR
jgi:hypothetical protein